MIYCTVIQAHHRTTILKHTYLLRYLRYSSAEIMVDKADAATLLSTTPCSSQAKNRSPNWLLFCNGCHKQITQYDASKNNIISCLNGYWHREHFKCVYCQRVIGDYFNIDPTNDKQALCRDCFMNKFHPLCGICGTILYETCINALNKQFHKNCFCCMRCHLPFPNGEYLTLNGKLYDEDCYFKEKAEQILLP